MIRMSQAAEANCHVVWTTCLIVVLWLAGCCGNGPTHKCDFTPPNVPGNDGGTDGPMLCGTAVCEDGKVCCYKKAPPLALCIAPTSFEELKCEKMDLPCFTPDECPEGMTCCLGLKDLTVTCRPQLLCTGDGVDTLRACGSELDCPFTAPTCSVVGQADGKDFKVCAP
jgi:hypothetical protein